MNAQLSQNSPLGKKLTPMRSRRHKSLLSAGSHWRNRIVSRSSASASSVHTDHLGTPRAGTDNTGKIVWRWEGEACGATAPTGTATVNLRFPGMVADSETGLFYNNARYFDSRTCRYISADPIGLAGGLNEYDYAYQNPLRYIDPSGLSGIDTLFMNDNAPLVVTGRAFGGLAALIEGIATNNEALTNTALEGLDESSQTNVEVLAVLATLGRGRVSGGMCRVTDNAAKSPKQFSTEKQALIDMAKADKRKGITSADMQAYKNLNKGLPDPFPSNKVRGPEAHPMGGSHSQQPHGHVGPVNYIPIIDPKL